MAVEVPPANPLKAVALKVGSVLVFVLMVTVIKITAPDVPAGQQVFFRSFFAIPVILLWLILRGESARVLRTHRPMGHFYRGFIGTMAMALGFAGTGLLPLPEVTAIGYAAPLLTVIFAAMFLGEEVRAFRLAAVGLGLVGVMVVLSPRLSAVGEGLTTREQLGAALALMGACCMSLAQIFVRKLVQEEAAATIVFWFSVTSTLLALLTLPWGWVMPDLGTAMLLVSLGLLGGTGQILMTSAFRYADASLVAPFEYASMLFALAIGYLWFAEVPTLTMLAGAALVILAGVLIIWRERRLGLERARQRKAMTPQG